MKRSRAVTLGLVPLAVAALAATASLPASAAAKPLVKACHGNGVRACPTSSPAPSPTVTVTPTPTPTDTSPSPDPTTTPASPPPTATTAMDPLPTVPAGTIVPTTLAFDDEFDGTAVDTSKWTVTDGWTVNNVTTRAANVTESGGLLHLQLATEGTLVTGGHLFTDYGTGRYQLPVGGFTEARVFFPGDSLQECFNWPAWWTSGPSWPAAGELDIAECLTASTPGTSKLTINYHSPTANPGFNPPGLYGNAFHVFGAYRKASSVDFYWDGVLVWTVATADNGLGQVLILNIGKSNSRTPVLGAAGEVQVDYVRAWKPA